MGMAIYLAWTFEEETNRKVISSMDLYVSNSPTETGDVFTFTAANLIFKNKSYSRLSLCERLCITIRHWCL